MRAMIVGAGIGGLTAAIALRTAGIDATVFERAREIKEVGAGILLAANAVSALGEIGLSDDVPIAMRTYEDLRRERTARIVRSSRTVGRIGQIENPLLCGLRNAALKATPTRLQLRQFEWLMSPQRPE